MTSKTEISIFHQSVSLPIDGCTASMIDRSPSILKNLRGGLYHFTIFPLVIKNASRKIASFKCNTVHISIQERWVETSFLLSISLAIPKWNIFFF